MFELPVCSMGGTDLLNWWDRVRDEYTFAEAVYQKETLVDGADALVSGCADELVVVVESKDRRRDDIFI
jgi:hypothetical protein